MLRMPRKIVRQAQTRHQNPRTAVLRDSLVADITLILAQNSKLTWTHFEALRIKLARALSSKRKLSRKSFYKHQKRQADAQKRKLAAQQPPIPDSQKSVEKDYKMRAHVWYTGFPHLAYRTKGRGSRMGKGKGNVTCWYFKGRAGQTIARIHHTNLIRARHTAHKVSRLLPIYACVTRVIHNHWRTRWNIGCLIFMVTNYIIIHFSSAQQFSISKFSRSGIDVYSIQALLVTRCIVASSNKLVDVC